MKRFFLKPAFVVLTFLVGVIAAGFWCFSQIESASEKSLSKAIISVAPLKPVFENPCDYLQTPDSEIKAEEAVYLAECFIIKNGYTDLPPIADKSKLTPESVFPLTNEEGLKMRHDSLERKAYSYERDDKFYGGSWIIMFRYKPHPEIVEFYGESFKYRGRAVIMDFYGKRIRIQHSDYPFTNPDAKIINP